MSELDPIEIRRQEFDTISRWRHLDSAVRLTRMMGVLIAGLGGLIIFLSDSRRTSIYTVAGVSTFLVTPGLIYIVAGLFLKHKRYWAWVTSLVMTLILLGLIFIFGLLLLLDLVRDPASGDETVMPAIACVCLLCGLGSVLFSLFRCRAAVIEYEEAAQPAFAVIPVMRPAAPSQPPPAQAVAATSPSASPPAPSPLHTPRQP